ncbi:assimilatory nitrite reductase (NAD(P)H) small subunit [Tamilnaduibacter salinus]|uniref:Assimilatory nitrite reductase (NAD(P)H) small subunit n=1 Tax=Tamilnaduibacter salinus TaxID=1484056 RepID=A0A2U1CXW2_9GAMM|nr:nitrite reductase small subunit NirD [Tamilnaduibacter salinus]PVY77334.1 assimilatory nitrite reductase (NAD(P)H) small subunit [Tamilnaduibacter salinus]
MSQSNQWQTICQTSDLIPHSGIAAWTERGPVAIFWRPGCEPELSAIGHFDPIARADVLARGIVGDVDGEPVVASPLYKQHFSLRTGECLEEEARVPVFPVRTEGNQVQLSLRDSASESASAA